MTPKSGLINTKPIGRRQQLPGPGNRQKIAAIIPVKLGHAGSPFLSIFLHNNYILLLIVLQFLLCCSGDEINKKTEIDLKHPQSTQVKGAQQHDQHRTFHQ
jgi:hypothetical protein